MFSRIISNWLAVHGESEGLELKLGHTMTLADVMGDEHSLEILNRILNKYNYPPNISINAPLKVLNCTRRLTDLDCTKGMAECTVWSDPTLELEEFLHGCRGETG